jgi:hypothetical protein
MKGLDLARAYYAACGREMLEKKFPAYQNRIACGLAGEGSECLGFDDAVSGDHDFGPGFCMWLTDDDFGRIGESLRAAYDELPRVFASREKRNPVSFGEWRLSALRTTGFYQKFTGLPRAPETLEEWRVIPEHFLAAAVSGEVFVDELGEFSAIRNKLLRFYPEDVRLKKIAARIAVAAQAGQYNFARCCRHGEQTAAFLALAEFIRAVCSVTYLLNRRYMPYYKWACRGLKNLPVLPKMHALVNKFSEILQTGDPDGDFSALRILIEEICAVLLEELTMQKLTAGGSDFLLDHCDEIMSHVQDEKLRAMHIMAG